MEISSVSLFEYISIVGHYNKLVLDKKVDPRLLSRGYSDQALAELKSKMGKLPSEIISLDVHFKRGVEQFEIEYFGYAMTLFDAYDRLGILPYSGSFSDQPAKIIEIFGVLEQLKFERQQNQQEQHEREMKKQKKRK
jgi:hypothetical protein